MLRTSAQTIGCGRKLGPFDCCTVVQGDCMELMKQLPDGCVDAVITDPPYGISFVHGAEYIANATRFSGVAVVGDDKPFDPSPWLQYPCVLWGANHFAARLPVGGRWLVWDKRCGTGDGKAMSDVEIAWVSGERKADRIYRQLWDGFNKDGEERGVPRVHPTQKPIPLMQWCIGFLPEAHTVLDPFLGSGTTAVAAKKLGRHFLGFEISPEYCEIARKRIALVEAQPTLFEPKAEQLKIGGLRGD